MTVITPESKTTDEFVLVEVQAGDELLIREDVSLIGPTRGAFLYSSGNVQVLGTIDAGFAAVDGSLADGADFFVGEKGVIKSGVDDGIALGVNGATFENRGSILGGSAGLWLARFFDPYHDASDYDFDATNITNSGTIEAQSYGVRVLGFGPANLTNDGTIKGGYLAYDNSYDSQDKVINRGLMQGGVHLGARSDFLDTREGRIQGKVDAGAGDDKLLGGRFSDVLNGDGGTDRIYGGDGNDDINGGGNNDFLYGDSGRDTLNGSKGGDTMTGGSGRDAFVFWSDLRAGADTITDFSSKYDHFTLYRTAFPTLSAGTLDSTQFKLITSPKQTGGIDKSDRILYDQKDGDLYYDSDGSGTVYNPIKFATVDDNTKLSHIDFLIV